MKLYKIPEYVITEIVNQKDLPDRGKHEMIRTIEGFKYPIKVVFIVEIDYILIVTAYPYKRGIK